jgi:hypothetical protein
VGRNTELYAATELSYARLLRATGENAAAEQAEKEANASLETMPQQRCNGCTISAATLK